MRASSPTHKRCALTLVEVMLAVVLGSAVVTMASVVTVDSLTVRDRSEALLAKRWERLGVLDQFEEDLRQAITWLPESVKVIALSPEPDQLVEIYSLVSVPSVDSPFRRRLPAGVVYWVRQSPETDGKQLVRRVFHLTVKEPENSAWEEVVADGLAEVSVEAFANDGWTTHLDRSQSQEKTLRAVRLSCRWVDDIDRTSTRTVVLDYRAVDRG